MAIELPLDEMTVREKLDLIEVIWENLAQNPEQIPTPQWHKEELDRRRARADADPSVFKSWEEVKRQARERHER